MPTITAAILKAAAVIDPLNLAILLMGFIALSLVWLAAIAVKSSSRGKKDE